MSLFKVGFNFLRKLAADSKDGRTLPGVGDFTELKLRDNLAKWSVKNFTRELFRDIGNTSSTRPIQYLSRVPKTFFKKYLS